MIPHKLNVWLYNRDIVEVTYTYELNPGVKRLYEMFDQYVEIKSCLYKGVDIIKILSGDDIEYLESRIYESIESTL